MNNGVLLQLRDRIAGMLEADTKEYPISQLEVMQKLIDDVLEPRVKTNSLVKKIGEVMVAVQRVAKRGELQTAEGVVAVATADDVFDMVREELGKRALVVFGYPSKLDRDNGMTAVTFAMEIEDGDSGESRQVEGVRAEVPNSLAEKSIPAAYKVAHRMFLENLLLISKGDPIAESESKQAIEPGRTTITGPLTEIREEDVKDGEEPSVSIKVSGQLVFAKGAEIVTQMKALKAAGLPRRGFSIDVFKKEGTKYPRLVQVMDLGSVAEKARKG